SERMTMERNWVIAPRAAGASLDLVSSGQGGTDAPTEGPTSLRVTEIVAANSGALWSPTVGRFRLRVVEGAQDGADWESAGAVCAIGSDAGNALRLDAPTVSRFHCEIRVGADGARIVDLGSRNGTLVDGVQVKEAFLRSGSLIRLGTAVLRFELIEGGNRLLVSNNTSFGEL